MTPIFCYEVVLLMPTAIIPKDKVIERLAEAFRLWGYDAATLSRLAEATGLVKASLYHYFPKGKQDMARAVLNHLGDRFQEEVMNPVQQAPDPRTAFGILGEKLYAFYYQGRASCLMELFTLGTAGPLFAATVKARLMSIHEALAALARTAGIPDEQANARAGKALAMIQGSLVVARGTGDPELVGRHMQDLANLMLD